MEQHYHVVWEMDVYASSPKEAAEHAWDHMRTPDSTANVFDVIDERGDSTRVDLMEDEEDGDTNQTHP